MDSPRERASLGRSEPWMRAVGFAIWAFVGLSHLGARVPQGVPLGDRRWLAPWLAFGVAFAVSAWRSRLGHRAQVGLLLAQTACVLALPWLGLSGFEGLLLAIVVAQTPTVLSFRSSVTWAVVQAVPLALTVLPWKSVFEITEILGAYSSFSAFALLVYRLHLQERRARAELAEANAALVSMQAVLVEGTLQNERLRISRELHDSLGHHLTALSLQLELAQHVVQGAATEPVAKARSIARDSLTEVRHVAHELQSPGARDLVAAVRAMAGALPVPRISIDAPSELLVSSAEASHALFRIIQEAITNAVRHGAARNIRVRLTEEPSAIVVSVHDDGAGAAEIVRGKGLDGMFARASQLGGEVELITAQGSGFEVKVVVPKERAP